MTVAPGTQQISEPAIVWDLETGQKVQTYDVVTSVQSDRRRADFTSANFNRDGQRLVLRRENGVVTVTEPVSARILTEIPKSEVDFRKWDIRARFSPNADLIVTESKEKVSVRDAYNGKLLHTLPVASSPRIEFNPKRPLLYLRDKEGARLWNYITGEIVENLIQDPGRPDRVNVFTPDGENIVLIGRNDLAMKIWNIDKREVVKTYILGVPTTGITFSPDGSIFVSRTEHNRVIAFSVETGLVVYQTFVDGESESPIEFSSDSKRLFLCGDDQKFTVLRAADGIPIQSIRGAGTLLTSFSSPDGKRILLTTDHGVEVWRR